MTSDESEADLTRSYVALTAGTKVEHYEIIEKLGAGGMGEVYLALDTKLNRQVALKFLPQYLCGDEECRKRFGREAWAAAALDHPNIAAIYEVGEYQGRPFYAMQVVQGQSLREAIAGKDLPVERVIEIATQICAGLQAAHDRGIIHRDVKPSNILLDESGRVRIIDFGLAAVQGSEQLTRTGSTLGTIGYMSPEQVQGQAVDQRSDLFSLGVVLYELITKQNPFHRESEVATVRAVVEKTPEPIARFIAELPEGLQNIVTKALEKNVVTRYQHAADLIADLVRIRRELESGHSSAGTVSVGRRRRNLWLAVLTIGILAVGTTLFVIKPWAVKGVVEPSGRIMLAVLPFENLGDPGDEYFADGITEEISSRLAGVKNLGVISRTSAYAYKKSAKSLPQIGRELGVDYVLEGTLRWDRRGDSDRVLVTPQLIDVGQDAQMWSDRYERRLNDIFAVQRDIAVQVVAALDITLVGDDSSRIEPPTTGNLAAYEAFIKGKESYRRLEWDDATYWLEQATQLDSNFADAWAYLSVSYYRAMLQSMGKDSSVALKALTTAKRALSLNPHLAAGHVALGQYYYLRADYDRAASEYELAIEAAPSFSEALFQLGLIRRRQGRWAESCHALKRGLIVDPLNVLALGSYVESAKLAREAEDAMLFVDDLVSRFPENLSLKTASVVMHYHCEGPTEAVRQQLRECVRALSASSLGAEERKSIIESFAELGLQMRDTGLVREALVLYPRFEQPDMMGLYYIIAGELNALQPRSFQTQAYFDSARVALESWEAGGSEQGRAYARMFLAWIAARLGNREWAAGLLDSVDIFARRQGDLFLKNHVLLGRCRVYAVLGDKKEAIACLDSLMASNGWVSPYELEYDLTWDPLRGEPEFEALIRKYAGIDSN